MGLIPIKQRLKFSSAIGSIALMVAALTISAPYAQARSGMFDEGGLTATGGVTSISGTAGGGLNPLAFIGGYETDTQIGGTAFYTHLIAGSFTMNAGGALIGIDNRFEISVARQNFNLGSPGASLGLGSDFNLRQNIFSAKLRLFGNAVYDQNSLEPVVSVGVQYHENISPAYPGTGRNIVDILGSHPDGTTYYIVATKLWLDGLLGHYTVLSGGLRLTNSNYNGLLGFGGTNDAGVYKSGYHVEPFVTTAYFLNRQIAVGYEYRGNPHFNVGGPANFSSTSAWQDAFIAYFPTKNISITAAYVNLGTVLNTKNSNGLYLSLTGYF
ncbi:MAG: DUF3034 family protein [Acidiphilium sp.]|nr:DUF3034 family protein [Acidiphilium sp.]MDD4935531.1 DUF3034 family protein [Acidiphilium sp.]